jgi:hypothetical protein
MYNLCCFVVKLILSRFTHFCRKICFVAIYALLCGEKLNQKLPLWRKNDKYEVWAGLVVLDFFLSAHPTGWAESISGFGVCVCVCVSVITSNMTIISARRLHRPL